MLRTQVTLAPTLLCVFIALFGGCSGSDPSAAEQLDPPAPVDPTGGTLSLNGVTLVVPSAAVTERLFLSVTPQDSLGSLPALAVPEVSRPLVLASKVFALTPHGTRFLNPVSVSLPYSGEADLVMRLSDERDTSWERVDGVSFERGLATFQVSGFSIYVVARIERGGSTGPGVQGQRVVEVADGALRHIGKDQRSFYDGALSWTEDTGESLLLRRAVLSNQGQASVSTVLTAEWVPDPGTGHPPLLETAAHYLFPVFGQIDSGSGLFVTEGVASVRKSDRRVELNLFDGQWLFARQDDVVFRASSGEVFSVSPATAALSSVAAFPAVTADVGCVFDATGGEAGCVDAERVVSFRFSDARARVLASTSDGQGEGSPRIAFNTTHWFVAGAAGVVAYAREGAGTVRYDGVIARGGIVADDNALFVCQAGVLTRVSVVDKSQRTLTEDCGDARGVSIVGQDATFIYYVHQSREAVEYPSVPSGERLLIYRADKSNAASR